MTRAVRVSPAEDITRKATASNLGEPNRYSGLKWQLLGFTVADMTMYLAIKQRIELAELFQGRMSKIGKT